MRIDELRALLDSYPDDVEVAVAAHVPAGAVTDVAHSAIVGVDRSLDDTGNSTAVWLVAIRAPLTPVPSLLTFTCP